MRLFSGPLSLFTAKVRIALAEKNLPYELISVPFSRSDGYSPKLPEMLAINPKGQVPVLIDSDLALYDSTIILEYLEERYPVPALYPADPKARALCRQAEAASDEILFPLVWPLIEEVFYKADAAQRDAAKIASYTASIHDEYDVLERRLDGREYFCGQFTVADIAYFLTIMFATFLGVPPTEKHRNLNNWFSRLGQRPSVKAEVDGMTAAASRL
jgi:glutathione S-transferase